MINEMFTEIHHFFQIFIYEKNIFFFFVKQMDLNFSVRIEQPFLKLS